MGTLLLVTQLVAMLPELVAKGIQVASLVANVRRVFDENRVVGDADWDALEPQIAALQLQFRDAAKD